MICLRLERLARPGMQPSLAHEPNATMNLDLRRSSLARWTVLVGPHAAVERE